ncbi:hypothetical protein [Streptomyces endophytica]|uniref:Uncharacterized protein n=1 Tax=Streptomyces endophytica TaxID=2991496 RepID=A0ABY6PHX4_9ACTN|nr:hypothetical protein [Streptomyces endophytica]UZJ33494.1 hypothetical protein OJ254_28480 [Streptomyces endophytica]
MGSTVGERRIGDPNPRIIRIKRKRWLIAALIFLVVAVPGVFYFSGAYDSWNDGRSLSNACRGSIESSQLKQLLGVDSLTAKDASADDHPNFDSGTLHRCIVSSKANGNYLDVSLDWNGNPDGGLGELRDGSFGRDFGPVSPIGHGWRGVVTGAEDRGAAVVVMSCSNKGRDRSLLVTLDGTFSAASSAQKTRLGFTAVHTAERAAKAWGCKTDPGRGQVNVIPGNNSMKPELPGVAKGTCQGIRVSGIGSHADGNAPIEDCFIQAKDGRGTQYIMSAYYYPFDKAYGRYNIRSGEGGDETYYAAAECRNGHRARYVIGSWSNYRGRDIDGSETFSGDAVRGKKQALKEFATRSAKRHGCTDLKLP